MNSCTRFILAALLVFNLQSFAVTVGFENITDNSGIAASLSPLFELNVVADGDKVDFTISNFGLTDQPFINSIYFDDNAAVLAAIFAIPNNADVSYFNDTPPENLPSGNTIGFEADWEFTADPPPSKTGINGGESGTFTFSLVVGKTIDDVIAALVANDLRIGIHVQGVGFDNQYSESFVTITPSPSAVPEPSTYLLFALGLFALAVVRRKA